MKTRIFLASLATVLVGASLALAAEMQMGTWKLNEAKSKMPAGMAKNTMVVYSMDGDMIKCVVDGVDKDGKPAHNEWKGKFDGKDYAVTGDPASDMRSAKKADAHTLDLAVKKDGKTTMTGKAVISHDGKTRTLTMKTADGKTATAVYDKQ
jgi:hypothetical protein